MRLIEPCLAVGARGWVAGRLRRACRAWTRMFYPGEALHLTCYASNSAGRKTYDAAGGTLCDVRWPVLLHLFPPVSLSPHTDLCHPHTQTHANPTTLLNAPPLPPFPHHPHSPHSPYLGLLALPHWVHCQRASSVSVSIGCDESSHENFRGERAANLGAGLNAPEAIISMRWARWANQEKPDKQGWRGGMHRHK